MTVGGTRYPGCIDVLRGHKSSGGPILCSACDGDESWTIWRGFKKLLMAALCVSTLFRFVSLVAFLGTATHLNRNLGQMLI